MKKLYLALIFGLILISLVSANEVHKLNELTSLRFTCTLNNAIPSASATYNITISDFNGKVLVDNQLASALGQGTFNYNVTFPNLGIYKVESFCYEGIYSFSNEEDIEVTQTGTIQTTSQSIGSLAFIILTLFSTVLLGYLSFRFMDSDTLWVLGVFFFAMFVLLITYDIWLAYEFKLNFSGTAQYSGIPYVIFYIFLLVISVGFLSALVLLVTKWKKLVKLFKKSIKPEPKDEDLFDNETY